MYIWSLHINEYTDSTLCIFVVTIFMQHIDKNNFTVVIFRYIKQIFKCQLCILYFQRVVGDKLANTPLWSNLVSFSDFVTSLPFPFHDVKSMRFILPFIGAMWNGGIGTYKGCKHDINVENCIWHFFSCAAKQVETSYVDDYLGGADSWKEAMQLQGEMHSVLLKGRFLQLQGEMHSLLLKGGFC